MPSVETARPRVSSLLLIVYMTSIQQIGNIIFHNSTTRNNHPYHSFHLVQSYWQFFPMEKIFWFGMPPMHGPPKHYRRDRIGKTNEPSPMEINKAIWIVHPADWVANEKCSSILLVSPLPVFIDIHLLFRMHHFIFLPIFLFSPYFGSFDLCHSTFSPIWRFLG